MSDLGDIVNKAGKDAWNTVSAKETWNKVGAALQGTRESLTDWSKEAWLNSKAGVDCLRDAGSDAKAILACRRNLHQSFGKSGANDLAFNFFISACLLLLLLLARQS